MTRGRKHYPGRESRKDSVSNSEQWILYALGQIDDRIADMDTRLNGRLDKMGDRFDAIDKRLRWIERFLWMALGAAALLFVILRWFVPEASS